MMINKIEMRKTSCLLVFIVLLIAARAMTAEPAEMSGQPADRYRVVFSSKDFKMNRDAVKSEVPEGGAYRIIPRTANADIWTSFPIPEGERGRPEWVASARLRTSDGPAAGVGISTGGGEYAVCVYPDGRGVLACFDEKKVSWSSEFKIKNFTYPVNVSLWRDANGSIIARVRGAVVAARLFDFDMKSPRTDRVHSVFFATRPSGKQGSSAVYEVLAAEGWGTRMETPKLADAEE